MNFNPLPYLARVWTGGSLEEGQARHAFLVSPTHALTTADVIPQRGEGSRLPSGDPIPPTFIDFPDNPTIAPTQVVPEVIVHDADFAIVRLPKPVGPMGGLPLNAEMPPLNSNWEGHVVASPEGNHLYFYRVAGLVERRLFFESQNQPGADTPTSSEAARRTVIRLSVGETPDGLRYNPSGAAIFVDDRVVGMVSSAPPNAGRWLAIPIAAMIEGSNGERIRELLGVEPAPQSEKAAASSQPYASSGDVEVTVADLSGAFIPGAHISLTSSTGGQPFAATSDEHGQFEFLQIPADVYSIEVEAPGFQKFVQDKLVVSPFKKVRVVAQLNVASPEEEAAATNQESSEAQSAAALDQDKTEAAASGPHPGEVPAILAGSADLDPDTLYRRLSPGSIRALSHAEGIRRYRDREEIHLEYLIAGLFENDRGPTKLLFRKHRVDRARLSTLVQQAGGFALPSLPDYKPVKITSLPAVTFRVSQALRIARDSADRTGSTEIQSRHLLLGALSLDPSELVTLLRAEGIQTDDELLIGIAPETRGPKSIPYLNADNTEGKDLLDIKTDVAALSAVIAAKDVPTPFSIGLFGDWGSGKSFFMSRMDEQIERLKNIARKARGEAAYCENIVQIWFNAWSYMDTDLWASLVTEIFEGLARSIELDDNLAGGTVPATAKARLLAATASARDVVAEEERKRDAARDELQAVQQHLESLKKRDEEIEASLASTDTLKDVYSAVVADPDIKRQLDEAASRLNIPEAGESAEDLLAQIQEVNNIRSALKLQLQGWTATKKLLAAGAIVAIAGLIAYVMFVLLGDWLGQAVGKIVTLLSSLAGVIGAVLLYAKRALKIIQDFKTAHQQRIKEARDKVEEVPRKQQREIKSKVFQAERRVADAKLEVRRLELALEEMRADKKLLDFIRQRNMSTDYTSRLGTVARARRDFKELSDLLERARQERLSAAKDPSGPPPEASLPQIDRIVLYIDDLDRCGEDKVVKVLEAVHLLLAFKLFVVVVAVDSRWLLHSLRKHSATFQASLDGDSGISDEEITHWESTPMNYLEKIFQIPFYLRPMRGSGFRAIIDDAARTATRSTPYGAALRGSGTEPQTETGDQSRQQPAPDNTVGSVQPADQEVESALVERLPSQETQSVAPDQGQSATELGSAPSIAGDQSRAGSNDSPRRAGAGRPVNALSAGGQESSASNGGESATPTSRQGETATGQQEPDSTEHKTEETPDPSDANPTALHIEKWEFQFMKKLHRLILSPRAAKRFINIYRLMRVSITDEAELDLFVGNDREGEHRSALLLLAILTGYPSEATDILRDLIEEESPATWWEYVDSRRARIDGAGESTTTTQSVKRIEQQRWTELLDRLQDLRGVIPETEPREPFRKWAPKVARYSFQSGRVVGAQIDEIAED